MLELERGRWERALAERPGPLAMFVHTPLCGTCALARRMMGVAEQVRPDYPVYAVNLNLEPGLAQHYKIESVPCLLVRDAHGFWAKTYRFASVTDIVEKLDGSRR